MPDARPPAARADPTMPLGIAGFTYADLYEPARARRAARRVRPLVRGRAAPSTTRASTPYRACKGEGMTRARSRARRSSPPRRTSGASSASSSASRPSSTHFRESVRSDDPLWRFRKDFAKKRVLRADAGKAWTLGRRRRRAVAARARSQAMTPAPDRRHDGRGARRSPRRPCRSSRSTTWRARPPRPAARSGPTSSARARARSGAARALPLAAGRAWSGDGRRGARARRGVRARRPRGVARRAPRRRARPACAAGRRCTSRRRSTTTHLVEIEPPRRRDARALRRPRARAPPAARLLAHRSRACARARSSRRSTTACSATTATRTRAARACSTRRRARCKKNPLGVALAGLPARGEDQRDARDAAGGRARRRPGHHHGRQPDVPRHRPPHLQRLHEGLHLPEAGAGEHPAGRDARPHRDARTALGPRDLPAADALEPAQRRSGPYMRPYNGKNVLVVGLGPAGLHARAPPRVRGLRRRRRSTG